MRSPRLSDAECERIEELRRHGWGGRVIADKLGVSYGKVRWYLERNAHKTEPWAPGVTAALRVTEPVEPEPPTFRAVVFDIECTNLKSDLGLILCAAFLDLADGSITSRTIDDFGPRQSGEYHLARWIREQVSAADVVIGHNSVAFDRNYLNGVLARYGLEPLPKRLLIDTYQAAKYGFTGLPSSYSLRNLSHFFGLVEEKESLDKDEWRTALTDPDSMVALRVHCERDVAVTALLWQRIKSYYFSWRGR